ncbi:uncharacterized protein LOC112343298 [Selaginella moellendorffii]|uniref:uncharacterized protein LOC112343298 n=1 Tax=Selaginella moellendorffii TaxID=88036 RepID=UPI000D1CF7C9|nr:uncharacterized protein LOC112343298 [Selaginella moellendorffii]|eukprot:XP_024522267.1 uncharacterized protein LOC112343298 [Selaginella moellendorffii]
MFIHFPSFQLEAKIPSLQISHKAMASMMEKISDKLHMGHKKDQVAHNTATPVQSSTPPSHNTAPGSYGTPQPGMATTTTSTTTTQPQKEGLMDKIKKKKNQHKEKKKAGGGSSSSSSSSDSD